MKKPKRVSMSERAMAFIASSKFFYCVLGFLVLSAVWVAISSLYPMAFDEDFHLGMIRLYAEHWGPFSVSQTPDANKFGSVATDPSYLYHYLMSFPYRIMHALTKSEMAIVIALRLLNIALFAVAVWLYRKVLLAARVSRAATHLVLAVFVLIPVVPLLAGQINYDNLLLVVIAAALLLAIRIRDALRTSDQPSIVEVLSLVLVLIFGMIVKYAFLPVALVIGGYILYEMIRAGRRSAHLPSRMWHDLQSLHISMRFVLSVLFFAAILLFSQRYITNLVSYHDPVPDCGKVLTTEQCLEYGPWGRDYLYSLDKQGMTAKDPVSYTLHDFSWGMWSRLFFTLAGPTNEYATRKPLPVISISAIVLAAIGVVLSLIYSRSIFRQYPAFWLFLLTTGVYVVALWAQVYQLHVQTARPVAINGRYLLPFLPLLGAIMVVAYGKFIQQFSLEKYAVVVAAIVLLLFLQGGGPITYIVRSEPAWFWPNSWMQTANDGLRAGLRPMMYRGVPYFERSY